MSLDPHTDLVVDALREMGASFFRYNTDLADQYATEIFLDGGTILNRKTNKVVCLNEVKSVWVRRRATPSSLKDIGEYSTFLDEQWSLFTEIILSAVNKDALWVNHPLSSEVAKNKLRQLQVARDIGLSIPATRVTNDPESFLRMIKSSGNTLYKPISSSVIGDGENAIYANLIEEDAMPPQAVIDGLAVSPSIFQSYIEKQYELRITLVGSIVFAARITSQESEISKIDWRRYDFDCVKHEAMELPKEVEVKCKDLIRKLGLQYGAIDMVVTPDDEYVFLEVNANGQWAWIEMLTGLPISKGLAKLLTSRF